MINTNDILTIEKAKKFLKDNGFYTDNLWHIDDVKQNYECSDEDAQEVLDKTMQSEWLTEEIFIFMDEVCIRHELGVKKKQDEI